MADKHSQPVVGYPGQQPLPGFSTGLYKLRQQNRKDSITCWLLVGLAALASWSLGPTLAYFIWGMLSVFPLILNPDIANPDFMPDLDAMMMGGSTFIGLFGYVGGGIFSIGVGVWAYIIFTKTKDRTVHDLTYGNMALVLIDEQYGFLIEEAVQSKYRLVLGKVPQSGDLAGKVNHFAYYYKYYYRMSFGPTQLQVSSVSAESCWLEGCGLAACYTCPLILIAIVLRIILVRPRVLAIKIAVAEFLEGKHDYLLEQPAAQFSH